MLEIVGYDWPDGRTKQVAYINLGAGSAGLVGHIQELFVGVGGGWQVVDLTAIANAPSAEVLAGISGYEWQAGGTKQVVFMDSNSHIQELFVGVGGGWQVADLTAIANAPVAELTVPLRGYEWQAG